MIRAIPSTTGEHLYSFTRRGIIGLFALAGVTLTSIVLIVVALVGQHESSVQLGDQARRVEGLSDEHRGLIAGLEAEVGRERSQTLAARDAYCRLKRYETLSGGAVLRIAAGFHLLTPRAQAHWRLALRRVAQIPAATSCSGTPVSLKKSSGRPSGDMGLVSLGEALVSPSIGTPVFSSTPVRRAAPAPVRLTRPVRSPSPALSPPAPSEAHSPVSLSSPVEQHHPNGKKDGGRKGPSLKGSGAPTRPARPLDNTVPAGHRARGPRARAARPVSVSHAVLLPR